MKVSILVITYNQERFIAQALDSAFMQQADFDFEVVVGDDCSTDGTRQILMDYREQYGNRLRLVLPERNAGLHANIARTLGACTGQYVALLEGDDYWTSPSKLTKQVALLDARPGLAMCFHGVACCFEPGCEAVEVTVERFSRSVLTLHDLLRRNFMHTCSVMFRRGLFKKFPEWYFRLPVGDWPLHILNAQHGKIGYIDDVMATYRVHQGGVWSTRPLAWRVRQSIEVLETVADHLPVEARGAACRQLALQYLSSARLHAFGGDFHRAQEYLSRGVHMSLTCARTWLLDGAGPPPVAGGRSLASPGR